MTFGVTSHQFWLAVLLCGLVGHVAAQPQPTAAELYHDYCSVCHGDLGDGKSRARQGLMPPPKDFTAKGLKRSLSREAMVAMVLHGKPGTAMSAWKSRLTTAQAEEIVDYIRSEFMVDETPSHARGRDIYAQNCSVCHGDQGAGSVWASSSLKPPPRDFSRAVIPRERMLNAVIGGRQGTSMPAFGSQLSGEDIEWVVDYIRTEFMPDLPPPALVKPATPESSVPAAQGPADTVPQGDYAAGEALYLANCTACHGVEGGGNGPRAYFIFPKPRNFMTTSSRARFTRGSLFHAIKQGVRGKEMPAWGKVLDDQQISNLAEYVYRKFIQTESVDR